MTRISVGVKEGPADCIRIDDVAAALKKIERHKASYIHTYTVSGKKWDQ